MTQADEAFARKVADDFLRDMDTPSLSARHISIMAAVKNGIHHGRTQAEAEAKAREAALVEAAKVDAFNHGYLVAVSIMLHQHDDTVIAEDALRESGLRLPQAKALGLDEYDLQVLRPVFQEMERKDSLRRAALTKEPDA